MLINSHKSLHINDLHQHQSYNHSYVKYYSEGEASGFQTPIAPHELLKCQSNPSPITHLFFALLHRIAGLISGVRSLYQKILPEKIEGYGAHA